MASNPTKWKLNKAETKELEDQVAKLYDKLISEGKGKKEAQAERDEFHKAKALEMKSEKAAKSASKKAEKEQQKAKPGAATLMDSQTQRPDSNSSYHSKVMEAKNTILAHPVFKGIEADKPLKIQQNDGGVQACNRLVSFEFM